MSNQPNIVPNQDIDYDVEFRVLIRGLKLNQTTLALIDTAIQSAVLQEVATIDTGVRHRIVSPNDDPQTRSVLGNLSKILGLILNRDIVDPLV